ncbi:MAG TPA: hypothetical protein VIM12_19545 [Noviherbaspirillum sp.]|jgi:hypothetical protein|uniref:hypothetical protein n=1 Tax=Noviherbaspirillum sp. TaxID=1926288 RepID=UPI002F95DE4C
MPKFHALTRIAVLATLLSAALPGYASVEDRGAEPSADVDTAAGAEITAERLGVAFDEADGYGRDRLAQVYRWLYHTDGEPTGMVFGYRWRQFRFERAATVSAGPDDKERVAEIQRVRARFSRLSFRPAENLTLQLVRGRVSGLDYLVADESLRRTALSATYHAHLGSVSLESTLAWGRSSRRLRESTSGFLLEATARFAGVHALFSRLERVGSDELIRDSEGYRRQWFTLNRLSAGYFQEIQSSPGVQVQAGAFVTRHLVPSAFTPAYGENPTVYMMFLRFKLQ